MSQPTQIHALSATQLLAALEARALSSVEIVEALLARIDAVEPAVHAFVEVFREESRQQAALADAARARGITLGPLHGLPLTVKENIATRGSDQTLGIRSRKGKPAAEDAPVVKVLKDCGGIVLGKTNVPLLLLSMESNNDLFGTTANPWDTRRAPGGSSGGEGAAIATGGSPLGIGTDIGGSIRIPSAWCGVPGLKPTWGRWSMGGSAGAMPGQEVIKSQMGPMARTVGDLVLAMRAVSPERQRPYDPLVPPIPWGEPSALPLQGLRVGYYEADDVFPPAASVRRAVRESAEALAAAGAELIPFTPPNNVELVELYFAAVSADGGRTIDLSMGEQDFTPQLQTLVRIARLPTPVRVLAGQLMGLRGERRVARQLSVLGEKSVAELWRLAARRTALQRAEAAAWTAAGFDLLLAPPTVTPAALLGETGDWSLGAWHTMRYNVLDLPAGVVPVSRVRADETTRPAPADRLEKKAARFEQGSAGLPVCVQVVGRPWEEDKVLGLMLHLERLLRDRPEYPTTPIDPRAERI